MNLYVQRKTSEAVAELFFGDGNPRNRLWAARWLLHPLTSENFATEELQTLIAHIRAAIDSNNDPDNIELHHMTDEAVSKCARDVVRMAELSRNL
jgi:hypothetical protein